MSLVAALLVVNFNCNWIFLSVHVKLLAVVHVGSVHYYNTALVRYLQDTHRASTDRKQSANRPSTMIPIQLLLFGNFSLTVDGLPITRFRSQREAALLAYLAVEADHAHSRERLAGLLWPDKPEAVARQNLRQTLTNLRALLNDDQHQPPLLLAERNTVQWNRHSRYTLDVETFSTALVLCATHQHRDLATCTTCQTHLATAVAPYHGPLLDHFAFSDSDLFEEWLLMTRERFQHQAIQALNQLSAMAFAQGDWGQMAHFARRQVVLDSLHEPAHRQLLQALTSNGDRSGALSHFEHFVAHLQRELGVAPSPETQTLIEQIRVEAPAAQPAAHANVDPSVTPALPPQEEAPHPASLPSGQQVAQVSLHDWDGMAANSRLVGRTTEETQLQGWLHSGVRVICIWGRSGIGKTALAQAVARSQAERISIIVWRSVTNAPPLSALLNDLLTVLGDERIPETIDRQLHRLFDHLRRQRILLVLDNLETLLQAELAGRFRPAHEAYGQFFQRFVQDTHQSALILTSREQPELFAQLEEETPALRSLLLNGLSQAASQQLLATYGVPVSGGELEKLVERLSGNPARLKVAVQSIQEVFGGDVSTFLGQEVLMYGAGRDLFEQYRTRMPYIEGTILFWLAGACAPMPLAQLIAALVPPSAADMAVEAARYSANGIVEALHSLQRRALLEQTPGGFTVAAVVMQNINSFMLELLTQEVLTGVPGRILYEIGLVDSQATEEVRQNQRDRLIAPLDGRSPPQRGRR